MFTDLEGYASLTHVDEAGALADLQELERLVAPVLAVHHGRKVKSMGDGLLIEFPNARDAVEGAVDLQRSVHEHNVRKGTDRLRLRVGIHVGDVERRGRDILGDAVNIASRIEPLAEPGGVSLSAQVYDQVRNRVPYQIEGVGPQQLKGIHEPVDVYRVVLPWTAARRTTRRRNLPRIAVLPLANISPDPKDEFFADGLTEELISTLSQIEGLRVIARTSVMAYKSATKPLPQIVSELDVDTVLEGTVRKAGDRLRITTQLIDVQTQEHRWAETFDRRLEDIFAVQSEVARRIAEALKVTLRGSEARRLEERPAVSPESYLAYLKGRSFLRGRSNDDLFRAKAELERAISLDGNNGAAYSGLSDVTRLIGTLYRDAPLEVWDRSSRALAERAVELAPDLAEAHTSLAFSLWADYQYAEAENELRRAISISPSYAAGHHWYASLLADEARIEEAIVHWNLAEEADPLSSVTLANDALLLIMLRRLDEARLKIERLGGVEGQQALYHAARSEYFLALSDYPEALQERDILSQLQPDDLANEVGRAICYAHSGQRDRAMESLRRLETIDPVRRPNSGIAAIYAALGELDPCFEWLNRGAFETYDLDISGWRIDPRYEAIRRDPRFLELLKRMNLG